MKKKIGSLFMKTFIFVVCCFMGACKVVTPVESKYSIQVSYKVSRLLEIQSEMSLLANRRNLQFWFNEYVEVSEGNEYTPRLITLSREGIPEERLQVKISTAPYQGAKNISKMNIRFFYDSEFDAQALDALKEDLISLIAKE